jgi:hypothetical protein
MDLAFHFVKFKPTGAVLTMTDRSKHVRYMCFSSRETAVHCVEYISLFRSTNGVFPILDMSADITKLELPKNFKRRTMGDVAQFFEVDTVDRDELDLMARTTNANFMYVHKFKFDNNNLKNISFSGQEVDAYVDFDEYVANLEIM